MKQLKAFWNVVPQPRLLRFALLPVVIALSIVENTCYYIADKCRDANNDMQDWVDAHGRKN